MNYDWLFDIEVDEAADILNNDRTDLTKDELTVVYFIRAKQDDILFHIRLCLLKGFSLEGSILRGVCDTVRELKSR